MADGSVTIAVDADSKQAQKELQRVQRSIQTIEDRIQKINTMRSPLAQQAQELAAQLDRAKESLYQMQSASAGSFSSGQIAAQKENVAALQAEYNRVQSQVESYDRQLKSANYDLDAAKQKAGALTAEMTTASGAAENMAKASEKAAKSMNRFGKRLSSMFRSALIFTVISQGLSELRTWLGKTIKKNDEARAAIAKLKGALLTLAQPILQVVIPAFITFTNVLTRIITLISKIASRIFGTTYEASVSAAQALYDEETALEGVGSAAKKAGKSLASFDEINKLSDDSDSGGGGGGGDLTGIGSDAIAPDFSSLIKDELTPITELFAGAALLALGAILAFSGTDIPLGIGLMAVGALAIYGAVSQHWGEIANILTGQIAVITALVSGALLALGAILLFTGASIPLGLGLMIAGAVGLGATVAANWGTIAPLLQGAFSTILAIASGSLLALGTVLAFSGASLPLGIGLMAVGAAGLVAAAGVDWGSMSKFISESLDAILAFIGTALLAIGAVLAFSGANLPLGIGLMAAGAVSLAAAVALNWGSVASALESPIGTVVALVSGALLALGAVLAFSGANLPLGIGLMAAGAAGLAATAIANWGTIQTAMQGPIGSITALVGAALLALGAVLLFSGANIPLGLGLLAVGGVSLAAAIAPNWGFIQTKIKDCWNGITAFWDKYIAPVFTEEWWSDLAKQAMNGFISVFEGAINLIVEGVNWLIEQLNKIQISIPSWVPGIGGKHFGINIPLISQVELPRLASGAVIPPNNEFLAVLGDQKSGTNIETPLSTMVQAFKQAMNESGGGRSITIVLEMDRREFARAVYQANNEESQRVGVRLAGVRG